MSDNQETLPSGFERESGKCPKCGITPTVTSVGNFKLVTCGMIGADQWFMYPLAGCPMGRENATPQEKPVASEAESLERRARINQLSGKWDADIDELTINEMREFITILYAELAYADDLFSMQTGSKDDE